MKIKNIIIENSAVLVLVFLIFVFFWKILLSPNEMIYSDFSDILVNSGFKHDIAESFIKYGEIPLWNPYILSGTSIPGNNLYQLFYPSTIFFLFFPIDRLFGFLFVSSFFLTAIFMYFFMRIIKLDKLSSLISAIIFIFSGFFVLNISAGHIQEISSMLWVPLIFLLFELSIKKNNLFYGLLMGVLLALQIFAGYIQYFIYTLLALFLFSLYRFFLLQKEIGFKKSFRLFYVLVLALMVCLSLSAIQLLPSLEFSKYSNRASGVDYWFATRISFPPWHLITFLIPEFFGTPLDDSYLSTSNFWNLNAYVGILPLILAAIAPLFKRNKYTIFFSLLAVFSVLFSFGGYTPLFSFFYNYVPFFNMFRAPSRFLLFYIFSISVLAGFGANFLIEKIKFKDKEKLWKIIKISALIGLFTVGTIIFSFLGKDYIFSIGEKITVATYQRYLDIGVPPGPLEYYLGKIPLVYQYILNGLFVFLSLLIFSTFLIISRLKNISIKHFKILIILIIFFDLSFFGMKYIDVKSPEEIFAKPEPLKLLENDTSKYRILALNDIIPQHLASRYNIEIVEGGTGLQLEHHKQFLDIVGNRSLLIRDPTPLENIYYPKLIDLLNTKYIITDKELGDRFELVYSNNISVYENKNYLPRAFIVRNAKIIKEKEQIFNELRKEAFEPKEYVILEKDPGVPLINPGSFEEANISYYSPNKIINNVNLDYPGFLILSEVWYSGWKAYDNGKQTEIYKTNYALRSIFLKEGEHKVEFIYQPESLKTGTIITVLAIIFLIAFTLFYFFNQKIW